MSSVAESSQICTTNRMTISAAMASIAVSPREEVFTDGQKIQFSTVANIVARMPDRLFATLSGDRVDRLVFYDGKTFTLYARRVGYYATADAPPTIGQLAERLTDK